jgi:hypothetical protein
MKVRLADFPQLQLLAWGLHVDELEEDVAFELYERQWRHVDEATLTDAERRLIAALVAKWGKGVLHV